MSRTSADPMVGAPGFRLPDAAREPVCLEVFRGHRVVPYIYPRDGTLLSGEGHNLLAPYGAWKEKTLYGQVKMGTEPSTFLIDPAERIRRVWRRVEVQGHSDAVCETLTSLTAAGT